MFTSIILAAIVLLSAISLSATSVLAQSTSSSSSSSMAGGFAEITTTQTDNQIIITITRDTSFTPPPEGEEGTGVPETPEGPIIIIPDPGGSGNGTIIVPGENATTSPEGNVTLPSQGGNVTIVEPGGNVTQIEPPTNVTVIDNDTVVIAPPNQTVTETPANVTVIDPSITTEPEPAPCGCPVGVEGAAPDIQFPPGMDNITSTPIISNDTDITVNEPILPIPLPSEEGNGGDGNGDNGNNNDGNGGE